MLAMLAGAAAALASVDAVNYKADTEPVVKWARQRKVGRNEPCPCDSGKKFKKCCLQASGSEEPS